MKQIAPFSRSRIVLAWLIGVGACVTVYINVWNIHPGDPRQVIQETESYIAEFAKAVQPPPTPGDIFDQVVRDKAREKAWTEFNLKCDRLSSFNGYTARAKAMLHLNANPEQYPIYDVWQDRYTRSKAPWNYFETSERLRNTFFACVLSLVAATLGAWLLALLLSWLWYFILDRIKEFSLAIRGK